MESKKKQYQSVTVRKGKANGGQFNDDVDRTLTALGSYAASVKSSKGANIEKEEGWNAAGRSGKRSSGVVAARSDDSSPKRDVIIGKLDAENSRVVSAEKSTWVFVSCLQNSVEPTDLAVHI